MKYAHLFLAVTIILSLHAVFSGHAQAQGEPITLAETDWGWWRGPTRNGVASPNQDPPQQWDEETNVLWKTPIPGRGNGSPTVVGDRIFLATADEAQEIQSILCFDRKTGEQRWKTDLHQGGFASEGRQGHKLSCKASATVACDGEQIYCAFLNDNAIYITALDLEGEKRWQQKVSDFVMHQGYGASPALYGPLVIVSTDHKGGGVLAAFDRATGERIWTQQRPALPNYTSPIILPVHGRDQVVLTGCDQVSGYDPLTGELLWEVAGATTECVTSTVTDGQVVVATGGYPSKHVSVVEAKADGKELWRNETQVYVPSVLMHNKHLYVITDSGEAICYELATGTIAWEERLRAKFASSPVLVNGLIYATSNDGSTFIIKASPEAFELVQQNQLDTTEVSATPAICDSTIYMRIVRGKGEERQEMLYCIGN